MNLKLLWYCTKAKPYLTRIWKNQFELATSKEIVEQDALNGKITAESDFHVEKIGVINCFSYPLAYYDTIPLSSEGHAMDGSCLSNDELWDYLRGDNGYTIHIKNLNIFDKPKELSDYYKTFEPIIYRPIKETHSSSSAIYIPESKIYFMDYCNVLKKAPQNMMYVYDKDGVKYVLISVRPEWLCLILNGLKDVEVRRKVLKEML